MIAFVDKMNASYKVRIQIGNACARKFVYVRMVYVFLFRPTCIIDVSLHSNIEHWTELTQMVFGIVHGCFLFCAHIKCCVAVLAIMCVCVCVDELNWIFESISTVVGECGNNSCLKVNRHSVRWKLWPIGGFFLTCLYIQYNECREFDAVNLCLILLQICE